MFFYGQIYDSKFENYSLENQFGMWMIHFYKICHKSQQKLDIFLKNWKVVKVLSDTEFLKNKDEEIFV